MVSPRDPWLASLDDLLQEPGGEDRWFSAVRSRLEEAYIGAQTPRAQSGFSGDSTAWEQARRPIAAAINRSGSFLDIGAANGYLLETLTQWARLDGYDLDPYGLDISPALVAMACHRYPEWSNRFFTGNAMHWQPVARYDYVRTELVYVPEPLQSSYVDRLLRDIVAPGGRLIVCSYGSSRRPAPRAESMSDLLESWGLSVSGVATSEQNGVVVTNVAWVQA